MSLPRDISARERKKQRLIVTPEGLALPITLASRGARFGALLIDLTVLVGSMIVTSIALILIGVNIFEESMDDSGAVEFVMVLYILLTFFMRQGYFMFFELGPRGATPGKRLLHIRIAARDGGRLTAEAVIARNLLRDVELFLPVMFMLGNSSESSAAEWAAGIWFLIFAFFPFFNKDRLRAGDLIAGTWVVEAPRRRLAHALSTGDGAQGRSSATGAEYRFGAEELGIYGEYELQTLERVLREGRTEAQVAVAEAICKKIGWSSGTGDERAFLEAFYSQLRAKLEGDMRFGKRKADKNS